MKKKLVVLADTDRLRAFCVISGAWSGAPIQVTEVASCRLACFRRLAGPEGVAPREEAEAGVLDAVACEILALLECEGGDCYEVWNLGASPAVCSGLVERISWDARERLTRVEQGEWMGLAAEEVGRMFAN